MLGQLIDLDTGAVHAKHVPDFELLAAFLILKGAMTFLRYVHGALMYKDAASVVAGGLLRRTISNAILKSNPNSMRTKTRNGIIRFLDILLVQIFCECGKNGFWTHMFDSVIFDMPDGTSSPDHHNNVHARWKQKTTAPCICEFCFSAGSVSQHPSQTAITLHLEFQSGCSDMQVAKVVFSVHL